MPRFLRNGLRGLARLLTLFSSAVTQAPRWLRWTVAIAIVISTTTTVVATHWPWAPCAVPQEIVVAATGEVARAVEAVAGRSARDTADWRGCRSTNITVTSWKSADELRRKLKSGWRATPEQVPGARPHLWITDSPAEIEAALPVRPPGVRTVATSPLVIAVSEHVYKLLNGYASDAGRFTWRELVDRVGTLRPILRTHPLTSNVGLLATTGMAESHRGGVLDARWNALEAKVSGEAGWAKDVYDVMCDHLHADDTPGNPIPAIVMSERQFYEFKRARSATDDNAGDTTWTRADCPDAAARADRPPRLRALYPAPVGRGHGLVHQCVPLTWPERQTTPRLSEMIDDFCERLAHGLGRFGFRDAEGRLPSLDAAVELAPEATVDPAWPKSITPVLEQARIPSLGDRVVVAVDVSGSMNAPLNAGSSRLGAAVSTAREIAQKVKGRFTTEVWTYPTEPGGIDAPHLVTARGAASPQDGARLARHLTSLRGTDRPDGSLRRLVRAGLRALGDGGGRRVLVILTDGGTPDGLSEDDLAHAEGAKVVVLTFDGRGCGKAALANLAERGALYCARVDDAPPDQALSTAWSEIWSTDAVPE